MRTHGQLPRMRHIVSHSGTTLNKCCVAAHAGRRLRLIRTTPGYPGRTIVPMGGPDSNFARRIEKNVRTFRTFDAWVNRRRANSS